MDYQDLEIAGYQFEQDSSLDPGSTANVYRIWLEEGQEYNFRVWDSDDHAISHGHVYMNIGHSAWGNTKKFYTYESEYNINSFDPTIKLYSPDASLSAFADDGDWVDNRSFSSTQGAYWQDVQRAINAAGRTQLDDPEVDYIAKTTGFHEIHVGDKNQAGGDYALRIIVQGENVIREGRNDSNDTIHSTQSDDYSYGGSGEDTFVLSGSLENYEITRLNQKAIQVTDKREAGGDGKDIILGFE